MSNCPNCKSDMKDIKGSFSICRKCGNVYVPIDEIPSEYPLKNNMENGMKNGISSILNDTGKVENKRHLTEIIYAILISRGAAVITATELSTEITNAIDENYTYSTKNIKGE